MATKVSIYSFRLSYKQRQKLNALGGAEWIRHMIDTTKTFKQSGSAYASNGVFFESPECIRARENSLL